jgi:photosystem II stability/assembly factor-like uncharacterized protein
VKSPEKTGKMKSIKILMLIVAVWCGADIISAQTWTQTGAPSNYWASVASSADGTKLVAAAHPGSIYVSTNSGADWTQTSAPSNYWACVAASADGSKLVAVSDGPIYTSTNSGTTWMLANAPNEYWGSVASSADGNKLIAVAPGSFPNASPPGVIYTSTDSGLNWTQQSNPPGLPYAFSVASSADGNKLVTVASQVYYSTNSGNTWTQTGTPLLVGGATSPSQVVASSADGKKWAAAFTYDGSGNPAQIYISTNSGDSWTLTSAPSNMWISVAMSADGNRITAAAVENSPNVPGAIYTSTNFGATWISNNVPSQMWTSVATSADGGKWVATSGFNEFNAPRGSIYTLQSTPAPSINIEPINGDLNSSWTVPSTNFVMQQSPDLLNWADMTNRPVLNLTNLQNEVLLSPPGSNVFYRLKTQ